MPMPATPGPPLPIFQSSQSSVPMISQSWGVLLTARGPIDVRRFNTMSRDSSWDIIPPGRPVEVINLGAEDSEHHRCIINLGFYTTVDGIDIYHNVSGPPTYCLRLVYLSCQRVGSSVLLRSSDCAWMGNLALLLGDDGDLVLWEVTVTIELNDEGTIAVPGNPVKNLMTREIAARSRKMALYRGL
ncbi:hypothetical protein CMUS01_16600 [Colletotrichum musicola]|uniref:Uncharacterized protein n=1 Tax=Colletotrichum musicola TaxID=2175873 RepID=A0A8H6ILR5_9PEZI|nr:hypothetical protein CMUS01_16600 [Colletotrichum musicola]